MRRVFSLFAAAAVPLMAAGVATANSPAIHFSEPVAGAQVVCGTTVYTAVSGTLESVFHEGTSASGNMNVTGTTVPRNVVFEDAAGNLYRASGATWFGGTFNAQTETFQFTDTEHINIVSAQGGVVGWVRTTEHMSPNGKMVSVDLSTCVLPEED
jgi:hypothetical protein